VSMFCLLGPLVSSTCTLCCRQGSGVFTCVINCLTNKGADEGAWREVCDDGDEGCRPTGTRMMCKFSDPSRHTEPTHLQQRYVCSSGCEHNEGDEGHDEGLRVWL
jgi:hypothetical protein